MPTLTTSHSTASAHASRALAALAVVVLTLAGLYVLGAWVADAYWATIALSTAWMGLVSLGVFAFVRTRPAMRIPVGAAFLATAALSGAAFFYTSVLDKEVNENVVVGVPAAQAPTEGRAVNVQTHAGSFSGLSHDGRGTAAVVELPDRSRKLTLTGFETDAGPDLRVYLVAGRPSGESTDAGFQDLGRLKGNVGNQQYTIPDDVDVSKYSTVMIYCRAFSVGFTSAQLQRT